MQSLIKTLPFILVWDSSNSGTWYWRKVVFNVRTQLPQFHSSTVSGFCPRFDGKLMFWLILQYSIVYLSDSTFCPFLSHHSTFHSLTSENCQILRCHSLLSPSSAQRWALICVCVCVCHVGLCWWSRKPWESTQMALCLPSSPLSPKHCCL